MSKGAFVISLDFELHYGVSDTRTLATYGDNLLRTPAAVREMLDLFQQYAIHASWATVGMLCARDKSELDRHRPALEPTYADPLLSNYRLWPEIGSDESADPYHYAGPLLAAILAVAGQEVGTHTFSHYYCLEAGQTPAQFEADLKAALRLAAARGITLQSIVFPRNQYSSAHLAICGQLGIRSYRGNEDHWLYRPRNRAEESRLRRAGRLLDAYLPLSGHHYAQALSTAANQPVNVPASRFLRPYDPRLRLFDPLRLRRITREMTQAARRGGVYHLWWHPHNFGRYTAENLSFLERILQHYAGLRDRYGMRSLNMAEVAEGGEVGGGG